MPGTTSVETVVRSAWERRLLVVAVERSAIAVAIVLGAFVLMLLVGTQVLDARWLFLLAALGLGIAAYQVRQRLLAPYRVAQILDNRLNLCDSLSTAWFLLTRPASQPRDAIADFQIHGAEKAAQSVKVSEAFPFTGQRLWLIAGGLALVAASLFGLRYFVTHSLSIEASILPFQLSDVFERKDGDADETKTMRDKSKDADQAHSQKTTPKTNNEKDAKDQQRAEQPPMPQGNAPGADGQNPNQPAEMREAKEASDEQTKQKADAAGGSQQQKSGEKQGDDGEKADAGQKPSSDDPANSPKSSNGLIDRMKDALSSMAAKMRPNNQGKQQSSNEKTGEEQQTGDQNAPQEKNNSQTPSSSLNSSQQAQASQGQAQAQTQEKMRSAAGKSADQASGKSQSDSHSGIGSQDGDKATKDAEQLKAMGQLAEIIGKRSASATGDIMVENSSGKQRLQTDYSQRVGQHSDLGGEINRDEIPLMYQQYVREYMSQVRRQAKKHKPAASHVRAQER